MSKSRILIVEDELIVATDLQLRLESLGYEVVGLAREAGQAVALADRFRPHLVLMDIRLQGEVDGIAAAGSIRREFRLPVVFVTAYSEDDTLERAKAAEPFGYVLKPFEDRELRTVIELAIYKHRTDEEIRHLQRLYATLGQVNQTIVRVGSPEELFLGIVRIAVEFGQFKAARIDACDPRTGMLTRLESAGLTLAPPSLVLEEGAAIPRALLIAWQAARGGACGVCQDVVKPSTTEPGQECSLPAGVRSLAAVPIQFQGAVFGVLTFAAGEHQFFQEREIRLTEEIALDLSYALDRFEVERLRQQAERALRQRTVELQQLTQATQRELTERIEAEQRAEKALTLLEASLAQSPAGILIADAPDVTIRWANSAALSIRGQTDRPLTGIPVAVHSQVWQMLRPDGSPYPSEELPLSRAVLKGEVTQGEEVMMLNARGEHRWISANAAPIRDREGKITSGIVVFSDITERKRAAEERQRLQMQLVQAQKMESVGRLAGGVAHDFNNMLQAILGNASLALDRAPEDGALRDCLEEVLKSAKRSADLTRQLLAFARKQTIAPKVVDLNQVVGGMLKMLRRLIGEHIDLAWLPAPDLWPVKLDPSQVDQVMANLCVNARDAIHGHGRVTIETCTRSLDTTAASALGCVPGDYVVLVVADTGVGIDPSLRPHLFEPFFTTKDVGQGTGLGLATVFGIVRQNGGVIDVESSPGQGTIFRIYLPRSEEETSAPESPPIRRCLRGTETVLLVEDEEQILSLGQCILQEHGYTVLAVADPQAALKLSAEHPGPIHLLVTDVVMPKINGRELFDRLRESRPGLRSLYVSGYTADLIAHHGVLDQGIHFLPKPFGVDDLAAKVRDVLEQPDPSPVRK